MNRSNDPRQFGKVAVLMGGWSAERNVSLNSGAAVLRALRKQGVEAVAVDVSHAACAQIGEQGFDRAFVVMHGRGGEDGVIQGFLEVLKLPYTGSGVLGSAQGMDKTSCKRLWQGMGLPTPEFMVINGEADLEAAGMLGYPLMIKPAREGSSIGMSKAVDMDSLQRGWVMARQYDSVVLAERWIDGAEYTVAILGERALPVIRLETPRRFYDYEAKYSATDTRYLIPCGLTAREEKGLQELALRAFEAVGASGWGRVDLMVDNQGQPWLIEVNTVPGMTDHSLVPMAAQADGLNFEQLVWSILLQTVEKPQ